jgi:tripartite-type tricarboxylate transporter receptor subunit TctC
MSETTNVPAVTEAYPTKPVRLIEPFGVGGGPDLLARALAQQLSKLWGQAVTVENIPGAGATAGPAQVAKSPPDGYTLLLTTSAQAYSAVFSKSLPYDPLKDLVPVTQVYGYTDVLVVNNDVPAKNVTELVALARAKPGQLTYGHAGIGTSLHLAAELFKSMAHVDVQQVPFRGSSLVITEVIGGRITMSFIPPTATLSIIQEGKVRALAVTSLTRAPFLPNVPTMDESGFPGFDVTTWFGMVVPARTSAAVIEKLNRATVKIMASADMHDRLHALGIVPLGNTSAEFADIIRAEEPYWARLIKDARIKQID